MKTIREILETPINIKLPKPNKYFFILVALLLYIGSFFMYIDIEKFVSRPVNANLPGAQTNKIVFVNALSYFFYPLLEIHSALTNVKYLYYRPN